MGTAPGAPDIGTNAKVGDQALDAITGSQRVMSNEHYQIHRSNAWEFSLQKSSVALNGTLLIQIKIGAAEMHLKELYAWADAAQARLEIIEGPTLTDGTTPVVPHNMNRAGGAAAPVGITMFSDPTGISGGTVLKSRDFGGGAGVGQTANPGETTTDRERILNANTDYLIRMTNLEANPRNFSIDGFFYRES